eukprot:1160728-Pelagomonas_calceolata.AAC.1
MRQDCRQGNNENRKEKYAPAKRPHALRKGPLTTASIDENKAEPRPGKHLRKEKSTQAKRPRALRKVPLTTASTDENKAEPRPGKHLRNENKSLRA